MPGSSRAAQVRAWCLYDWANSAFAVTAVAGVLPVYYVAVAARDLPAGRGLVLWSYSAAAALALAALQAPWLGAAADQTGRRIRWLAGYTIAGALASGLLGWAGAGEYALASALFIVAHLAWSGALVLYDALLPHLATAGDIDRISARGYAVGYAGSALVAAIDLALVATWGLAVGAPMAFGVTGLWWMLFAVPVLRQVPEPPRAPSPDGEAPAGLAAVARAAGRQLVETFRRLRHYRRPFQFLLAFWIYNDGITTIIKLAAAYGAELGIGHLELLGALLMLQAVAVPATLAFGRLAALTGAKTAILLSLAIYAAITVFACFMRTATHFWILAALVGLVQGGSQALSRSYYGTMIPPERSGEFFGFFDVSAKAAGLFGPLVFGVTAQLTGSSRLAILTIAAFFVAGGWLLTRVEADADPATRSDRRGSGH